MTKKNIYICFGCLLSLIFALCIQSCDINGEKGESISAQSKDGLAVIAEVNGEPIIEKDFLTYYNRFKDKFASSIKTGSNEEDQIKKNALNFLIEKKLIKQEATKLGIIVTDFEIEESVKKTLSAYNDDEALQTILKKGEITISEWRDQIAYNLLIEKISSHILDKNIEVSDKEVTKYYMKNLKEFEKPLRLRARQILVNSLEEAKEIRKNLLAGGDFQKIAREKSIAPEATKGGDLGYLSKGEMPDSFDEVLFDMPVGEVSRIVKTDYGFHIFLLVSKQNPEKTNPKEAFKIIRKRLIDEKSNIAFRNWKDQLTKQSVIKYH